MPPQFRYGLLPPKGAPALQLKDFLRAVPDHPPEADNLIDLDAWKVLGNNQHSNCAAVFWANMRRLMSAKAGKEYYPNQDQVYALYKTQNPGFPDQDDGMELQTMFEYLHHTGGPDGVKLLAFATVDTSNREEVDAALAIFGGLGGGIQVQGANQMDFANGVPWDYHPGQSIEGGHAVLLGGYSPDTKDDTKFITWGAETGMTDAYWDNLVNCPQGQAWICIWPEHLGTAQFMQGIDTAKLATAYQELTGRPFPAVAPNDNQGCSAFLAFLMKNGMKT